MRISISIGMRVRVAQRGRGVRRIAEFFLCGILVLAALSSSAAPGLKHAGTDAAIEVIDDLGATVSLPRPARRIVSLAPHATELLYVAGAGAFTVGAVDFSDYPEAARHLPRVGGAAGLDLEAIVALKPDLIVAWASGNSTRAIEQLRALGFMVYVTEPRRLEDVAHDIERLGELAGTTAVAHAAATEFRTRYRELAARYAGRRTISVFYQVLDPALITIGGRHVINEVITLCGGRNVFADLPALAPWIDREAVVRVDPEVIVGGGMEPVWQEWRARWLALRDLRAVRNDRLYFIPAELLHRHSPRMLAGMRLLCEALDRARVEEKNGVPAPGR